MKYYIVKIHDKFLRNIISDIEFFYKVKQQPYYLLDMGLYHRIYKINKINKKQSNKIEKIEYILNKHKVGELINNNVIWYGKNKL